MQQTLTMSRKVTNYLENNDKDVSCLTPIPKFGSHRGSNNIRVDNGIIAYGWIDKPVDSMAALEPGLKLVKALT